MSMPPLSAELQVRPAVGLFSYEASLISERFCEAYARIAESNRRRLQELNNILTAFQSTGIEVLPLKGVDLLGRAYGVLGLRPMVDVDLLVHQEDLPRIDPILRANSFQPRGNCGNPTYVSATRALCLDLFSEIWYWDDIDTIWQRAVPRQVAGRLRSAMHPEDALIYLVAYEIIHRGRLGLQMAVDVAIFLEAEERFIDWNHVVHEINNCGLRVPLHHGLSYARDKGGARIPPWVLEALRPPSSQRSLAGLYQRLVTEAGIPELGHFLLVFSRPGYKKKVQALRKTFFPSRDFLALRYGHRSRWDRLRVRLSRPAHLVFRGALLAYRIGWRLLLPFKEISAPGPPRAGLPATPVWSTSVQGETPLYPGTTERPTPTEQTQGHQHKAEET